MDHVSLLNYIEIVASILTVYSAYLIALPNIIGLILMSIAEVLWIYYCYQNQHYWMMGTNILLIISNIYGIKRWSTQDVG